MGFETPEKMESSEEDAIDKSVGSEYSKILERISIEWLKENDAEWFLREYSGEVSDEGYLINKDGKETNMLPSQCLNKGFEEVESSAEAEFKSTQETSSETDWGSFVGI